MSVERKRQPMAFEVTDAHIRLLARTYFRWIDYAYRGAPGVDPKRPFGNSDVERDIFEITQPERAAAMTEEEWDDWYEEEHDDLIVLFYELEFVVQIAIVMAGRGAVIRPGPYHRTGQYHSMSWVEGPA